MSYCHACLLGVVQLLNKLDGTSFNRNDQNLFEVCLVKSLQKNSNLQPCRSCKFWRDFQALKFALVVTAAMFDNALVLLQAFAIFCGMAIHNTVMYENVNKAMAKQKVALEVRNFKMYFFQVCFFVNVRHSSLMVSALVSGSSGPGLRRGQGHCVVFLDKTLNFHSVFLYPCV